MGNSEEIIRKISELRNQSFEGWSDDSRNGYLTALKTIEWLVNPNSHSPTISEINDPSNDDSQLIELRHLESDTLQEGDFFIGTEEQYRKVLELENNNSPLSMIDSWVETCKKHGYIVFYDVFFGWVEEHKKNQLTPEEFFRRAENTFKK